MKPGYIVVWPEGRPCEWQLIPDARGHTHAAPSWHAEARRLHAAGWSLRRIAKQLGVSYTQTQRVLSRRANVARLRRGR
jgi:Homeodomain-like domain